MRVLKPLPEEEESQYVRPTLRTNKPAAAYARRSDQKAKNEEKDKSPSREMQTEDMIDWGIGQGWKEHLLYPYFADLGLSGTLRPDQRPDMLRLFDDIDTGKYDHGSVICWQENRLFRDETQIYYNQFIDKCKMHDVVVVVVSPYLMIYDFRDDFLTEMFRWKCKESADFIKRHVKGWMLPARFRAAWVDGEWAGLGDPPTGYIVDFDEDSPTYKKLIPYWPHAEKKCELRLLFVELGCNISLLYSRLRESPILFPEFEGWVDQRNVSRFKMSRYPGGGYYPKYQSTIVSMLIDPSDMGYRVINGVIRRNRNGEKAIDHTPICEQWLFDLIYYPLAKTDLDGNPLEGKKKRRYFHQGDSGEYGLLKFRIISPHGEVRTHHGGYDGDLPSNTGVYVVESPDDESNLHHRVVHLAIATEELDALIVNRLMEHVREISHDKEAIAEYEKKAQTIRQQRQQKVKQIITSMNDIESNQLGLTISLGQVTKEIDEETDAEKTEYLERRKQLIIDQIDILEQERRKLIQAKAALEKEAKGDLGSLDAELKDLENLWPKKTFDKRRSLLNFLVQEVVIESMSTHWIRVQVLWLHEEWGREEMFYHRRKGVRKAWTEEEKAILQQHFETMPISQLRPLLPDRGWQGILWCANTKGLHRAPGRAVNETLGGDKYSSYSDIAFMQRMGIPVKSSYTNWQRRFQP